MALNDPDVARYAFVTAATPDDLLALVDQLLETESVDWRQSKGEWRKGGKSKA